MKSHARRGLWVVAGVIGIGGATVVVSQVAAQEPLQRTPTPTREFDVPCPPADSLYLGIGNPPTGWKSLKFSGDSTVDYLGVLAFANPPEFRVHCVYTRASGGKLRIEKIIRATSCRQVNDGKLLRCTPPR